MKIGIMSFAHHHAESYVHGLRQIPGVDLYGFSDEEPDRGAHYEAAFGLPYYPSHEALLAEGLDGIIVCSENANHRALVELAAGAGAHVLCEKPLATNVADAQAIVEACRAAGVILMTAFPMRFSAPLQQVKTQLDAGELGQVYACNSTNQGRMPGGERAWFVDKELAGGGAMMDHIVHLADVLRWYLGSEVTAVYAQANHILHADKVDVETGGLVMLTFANGIFATIDCSWSKPLNYPTWGGLTMELISERGLTKIDAFNQNLIVYQQEPSAHRWVPWGSNADLAMMAEFVAAIREGRAAAVTGQDGLRAVEITVAAYASAASGETVRL